MLVTRATGAAGAAANAGATDDEESPSVSSDGRFIAFISSATNLSGEDGDAVDDVFVRDLQANTTVLVSRAAGAAGAPAGEPASMEGRL